MIAKIPKHLCIGVANIQNISHGQAQEFNSITMRHMGYHWDNDLNVYYYNMKGSSKVIYNYDDPSDWIWYIFIDEHQVEEQAQNIDADTVDTPHDDEVPQGWKCVADEHDGP